MCLGALPWPSVRSLVCGARREDAEELSFDDGSKPLKWVRSLEEHGIALARDVLRDEAASVLQQCTEEGGEIYNGRRSG